jgi:hypothetical protein
MKLHEITPAIIEIIFIAYQRANNQAYHHTKDNFAQNISSNI